mgnify:FL=1
MSLVKLEIAQFRNLSHVQIEPGSQINLIHGANGSGKSSLLEAIFVLGLGRSFRTQRSRRLVKDDESLATVFGETRLGSRLGVSKQLTGTTDARINSMTAPNLSALAHHLPLQLFDPETLELVSGPSLPRRQLIDWGVFHVEPDFLEVWQRARRALQQRNSLLKSAKISIAELNVWEQELAVAASALHAFREQLMLRWLPELRLALASILPQSELSVDYYPGWDVTQDYQSLLAESRGKDRERGFTFFGPQRADLKIRSHGIAAEERLSRGQLKLAACSVKLSLSDWLKQTLGLSPVLLFDDLASELDIEARAKVCKWAEEMSVQAFFTSIERTQLLGLWPKQSVKVFHVEQGCVVPEST